MRVVLWDTRKAAVAKDEADGFGRLLRAPGRGLGGLVLRRWCDPVRTPPPILFGYLAAALGRQGHDVRYIVDRMPPPADLYVFRPALATLSIERRMVQRILQRDRAAQVLVVGPVPSGPVPVFAGWEATIVKGDAEQLGARLEEVLEHSRATVHLGWLEDLDHLPTPDWSTIRADRFDGRRTVPIEAGRPSPFAGKAPPDRPAHSTSLIRHPDLVADEMRQVIARTGICRFAFRDPVFGLQRAMLFPLGERLLRLRQEVRFSLRTRADLMTPEALRLLCRAGLCGLTIDVDRGGDSPQGSERRGLPSDDNELRDFFAQCRGMNLHTTAEFLVGLPADTEESILAAAARAVSLGPTVARFFLLTPYPGSAAALRLKDRIADFRLDRYDGRTAVLRYEALSAARVEALAAECYRRFHLGGQHIWPRWPALRSRRPLPSNRATPADSQGAHSAPPRPLSADAPTHSRSLRQDGPHVRPGHRGET